MARQDFVERDGWDSYIFKPSGPEFDGKITIDSDPSGQRDFHHRPGGGHRIRVTFPTDDPPTISFSKHDDGKHARMGEKTLLGPIVGKGKKPKKTHTDGDEDVIWVATKGGGTILDKKKKPSKTALKKTKPSRKKAGKK